MRALLSEIDELPQERYTMEFRDLADSLSEYVDNDMMDKCYTIRTPYLKKNRQ